MIKARNIHKFYSSTHVLKGIDIDIAQGEIVTIVGPSGAGKTTLLQVLGTLDGFSTAIRLKEKGIDPAVNPSLEIAGRSLEKLPDGELSRFRNRHIGFVFQFHQLLPEFTALENVCIPAMIAGGSLKDAEPEARRLLDYLGLSHRTSHKPSQLSGGEQQRVAVARALINRPEVVFADEPSGNLDSKNAEDLHRLFFDLREKMGQTFVIVTHNRELARMSDRRFEMRDGRIENISCGTDF